MTRWIAIAAAAFALGGCSWIYDTPYEEALYTGSPVEPPPGINGGSDLEAALPYEQSPWFDEGTLNLPEDSPVQAYEYPEDREMLELFLREEQQAEGPFDEAPVEEYYDPE